jgi:hypothetical protein
MKLTGFVLAFFVLIAAPLAVSAQVLGSCGAADENEPGAAMEPAQTAKAAPAQQLLRPGDRAVNFSLAAVVGDEIKMVKLSDYNGKWRVLCFYPADFTFV